MTDLGSWEKRIFQSLLIGVTASGLVYFVTKYGLENDDPFSVVNHPLEPIAFDLHILLAPFLMFAAGMLLRSHAWEKFRKRKRGRRRSGTFSAVLFFAMAATGYWLEVSSRPFLMNALRVLHILFAVGFVSVYLGHLFSGVGRKNYTVSRTVVLSAHALPSRELPDGQALMEPVRRAK